MSKNSILYRILGLNQLTRKERGLAYILLVTFVPLIYKLIVPFFIISGLGTYTIIINPTIMIVGLIMAKDLFWSNIKTVDILGYVFFVILLFFSQYLYPETKLFFEENYLYFISQIAIFFFVGLSMKVEHIERILLFIARMSVVVHVFWQACFMLGFVEKESSFDGSLGEQMEIAYQLLFPIFVLIIDLSKRKSNTNTFYLILALLLLIFMGTRGPIVICAIFVVSYYVIVNRFKTYNFIKKISIVLSFSLFYYFIVPLCEFIAPFAVSLGFSTRAFDSIIKQEMIDFDASSNRDDFYGSVFAAIQRNDGLGYGWGGDRLKTPTGGYAHNFVLEIICQFGWLIGGTIVITLIGYIIITYIKCKNQDDRNKQLMMFCLGFLSLQFSNTYVSYPLFFVFLGSLVALNRHNKSC